MILYTEYSEDSILKLLELINVFSKVIRYTINIQVSLSLFILAMKYHKGNVN